jgi:hypothetical protein
MKACVPLLACLLCLAACQYNNDREHEQDQNQGLLIKGQIPQRTKAGLTRSADSLSLEDADKVLVLSYWGNQFIDIDSGRFSIHPEWGTAIALLFLDSAYHYIGHLSTRGLNLLPLGNLSEGENTIIDLSMLRLEGHTVIPGYDPFGNEILLSEQEMLALQSLGEYYNAIAYNMDTDRDGQPDCLSGKGLMMSTIVVYPRCGRFGHNDRLPEVEPDSNCVNYTLQLSSGPDLLFSDSNIWFSGPEVDPYDDIRLNFIIEPGETLFNAYAGRPGGNNFEGVCQGEINLPFKKGVYTLKLDDREYKLIYANDNFNSGLVLPVPTIITRGDTLRMIKLDYQLIDGSNIEPSSMLNMLYVQIKDSKGNHDIQHDFGSGWSDWLTTRTGFDSIVPRDKMVFDNIEFMSVWYDDILGNHYSMIWRNVGVPNQAGMRKI